MKPAPKESIYLIHPFEFKIKDMNIYKVGRTRRYFSERLYEYQDGYTVCIVRNVFDAINIEKKILEIFIKEFKLVKGREYFEGNHIKMIAIINDIIDYEYNKIILEYNQKNSIEYNTNTNTNNTNTNKQKKYNCYYKCGYGTSKKNNIIFHLCRKKPCNEKNNKEYAYIPEEYIYLCKFCNKEFDNNNLICQHLRKSCKVKKEKLILTEYNKKKEEVNKLEQELFIKKNELSNIQNSTIMNNSCNTTNNITNNTANINITVNNNPIIVEFGK